MIKEAVDLGKDINESFDADSGSVVEKIVFSNRLVLVLMTLVISHLWPMSWWISWR